MAQEETIPKSKECYAPAKVVANFLDDLLQLSKEAKELRKELDAADDTEEESIRKQQEELKVKKKNLNRRKVDVLNKYIFPSMANLTVFVEATANDEFVERVLEEDLKALFLAESKGNKDRYKASRTIFTRFINASTKMVIQKYKGKDKSAISGFTPLDESRIILCNILQEAVLDAMESILLYYVEKYLPTLPHQILMNDVERARLWTSTFAMQPVKNLEFDRERRPALF